MTEARRILLIQGHPDPVSYHLNRTLLQAYAEGAKPFGHKPLSGRSARVVVTMGMPALAYRWFYRAHSVKSLERNILGFVGFAPVNETLIGSVDGLGAAGVARWQAKLQKLGRGAG